MIVDIGGVESNIVYLFILGCIAGFLSGFFGIGGSSLVTPILQVIFQIPFQICVGSSLAQTTGSSITAVLRHWKLGNVDFKLAFLILGVNFLGVESGARILDYLGSLDTFVIKNQEIHYVEYYSRWLFLLILLVIAGLITLESLPSNSLLKGRIKTKNETNTKLTGRLIQRLQIPPIIDFPKSNLYSISIVAITYPAFFIGITTGLLGIGGGVITVPLLIYGCGVPTNIAVGTSLLLVFFSTFYGTIIHSMRHNVDLTLLSTLLIGSTIFAQIGASMPQLISGHSIRFYFSFIVWALSILLIYDLITRFF